MNEMPLAHEKVGPPEIAKLGAQRFFLVQFNDVRLDTAPDYLIKGILPAEGIVVVWGPPKCGKSFWTFDLVMHVALNWFYRSHRVRPGPVVYVAAEGESGFKKRIEAFRQRYLPEVADDVPFYLAPFRLDLIADHDALIECIIRQIEGARPAVVVLDTLNRTLVGSESIDQDMSAYIKAADAVREAFECVVVIVHHCGIEVTRPRGHSSLTGAADAQIAVKRGKDGVIRATIEWMKDGEGQGDQIASALEVVEVGIDDDEEIITSCVIVPSEAIADGSQELKLSGQQRMALNLLRKALAEAGEMAPASNHIPKRRIVPIELWRTYCEAGRLSNADKPDSRRRAFHRCVADLRSKEIIGVWTDHVWVTDRADREGDA
jgi:hypothetical protein